MSMIRFSKKGTEKQQLFIIAHALGFQFKQPKYSKCSSSIQDFKTFNN